MHMGLGCFLMVFLLGKPIQPDTLPAMKIFCADQQLEEGFYWAQQKAMQFVQTGKSGPVNIWKPGQESPTVSYIPSYQAGYPLRSAFYSRDFCHQAIGAHLLGLDEENFSMLRALAASAHASRKWYPLWALNFDGSPYSLDYRNDTNFVREVPAVFELVETMARLYRWTGDSRYATDSVFSDFARHALSDFIRLHDNQLPNGIAEGSGTGNIFKGVASYNEQRDAPLVEAGDGIAAQYAAFMAYHSLHRVDGSRMTLNGMGQRGHQIQRYFQKKWAIQGSSSYNRGYLQNGQSVAGWGKENSWFMLMKGIVHPDSYRTAQYLDFLQEKLRSQEDMPDNIEALTYIPETFFRYHRNTVGWEWMQHILARIQQAHVQEKLTGTNGDYPEVSYVLISNVVEQLLGVEPLAAEATIKTLSHLPIGIPHLEVSGIPVGDCRLSVAHQGTCQSSLQYFGGKPKLVWTAAFPGAHHTIWVDGQPRRARKVRENGIWISTCRVEVAEGEKVVARVAANGRSASGRHHRG